MTFAIGSFTCSCVVRSRPRRSTTRRRNRSLFDRLRPSSALTWISGAQSETRHVHDFNLLTAHPLRPHDAGAPAHPRIPLELSDVPCQTKEKDRP